MTGQELEGVRNDPAVYRRHQIVSLSRRDKRPWSDNLSVLILQSQQDFKMTGRFAIMKWLDILVIDTETIFMQGVLYFIDPLHVLLSFEQVLIAVRVELNPVTTFFLCTVTGYFR